MYLRITLILSFLCIAAVTPARAGERLTVQQLPYSYSYEFARGVIGPTFLITRPMPTRPLVRAAGGKVAVAVSLRQTNKGKQKQTDITVVYFDLDSAELKPEAKALLDSIDTAFPVSVTGYTCPLGTRKHNTILAKKRAYAVANYLRRRGVRVVNTTGKGGCCFIDLNNLAKNRRVIIRRLTK